MQQTRNAVLFSLTLLVFTAGASNHVLGANPVIHAQWDDGGAEQPVLNFDYIVNTTSPASPAFPDVELITGRLDWRTWSTFADNPGDIGTISCPRAENFAVSILDASDGRGARDVKGITLVPSSSDNYSNVVGHPTRGSWISGKLIDDLTVQSDNSGTGGEVRFDGGASSADMTIRTVHFLGLAGEVSGTINIVKLADHMSTGPVSGEITIALASTNSVLRVLGEISGSVTVSEMADGFFVFFPDDVSQAGQVTFGEFFGTTRLDVGSTV